MPSDVRASIRKPRPWRICEACEQRFQQVNTRAGAVCPDCWREQTLEMQESEERWAEWLRGYHTGFRAGAEWERSYIEREVANGREDHRALRPEDCHDVA